MTVPTFDDYHYLAVNEELVQDPYPFFERLQEEAPVYREPDYGVYVVSRYDDVVSVLRQPEVFSNLGAAFRPYRDLPVPLDELPQWRDEQTNFDRILLNDPPDHARHRQLINPLFTTRRIAVLEPRIRELAGELIETFVDDGAVEFVAAYSKMLPPMVIGELLGLPREDAIMLNEQFRKSVSPRERTSTELEEDVSRDEVMARIAFLTDYFRDAVKERRKRPREGEIMSELATARFKDGEEVPLETLVLTILLLYVAGGEANTTELLSNIALLLARHPELQPELNANPDLVEPFVEEVLRYEAPLVGLFRVALSDASVGGVTIPEGETVMILFGAANRDERHFKCPHAFDMHQADRRHHIAFGHGIHRCPGAPLARLEGKVTTGELLARLTKIRLAAGQDKIPYLPGVVQRIPLKLFIEFEKAV